MSLTITQARTEADYALVKQLFLEYAASIGVDLEYQGFGAELARPGDVLRCARWIEQRSK